MDEQHRTALAVQHARTQALMDPRVWGMIREQAEVLVKSGMLPTSVRSPEAAIAIMMKGHELGMAPMQAFAQINVIQGKPCLTAEGMLAQIYKTIPGVIIDIVHSDNDYCEIMASRRGRNPTKFRFSKEDAATAGLSASQTWKKYPRTMLRWRCITEMARVMFPEALSGCSHTADELDPSVEVGEDGVIIDVPSPKMSPTHIRYEPVSPPSPAPLPIFDKDNPRHVERLGLRLATRGSSEELISAVTQAMHGKPMDPDLLDEVVKMAEMLRPATNVGKPHAEDDEKYEPTDEAF